MPTLCIECHSNKVQEIVEENKVYYLCGNCHTKSGKTILVGRKIKIINTSRGIKHIAVGGIIINDDKILLGNRRTFPFGLEIPVGHVEYDETLEDALSREIYEEVGLKVSSATLLGQFDHPVSYCRYGSDIEVWAVFLTECKAGNVFVKNNEMDKLVWLPLDAIPVNELTPSTHYALKRLGYIHADQNQPSA